eukprot:scaffold129562_cov33-Phaeocystis_antarctica.AAC.1
MSGSGLSKGGAPPPAPRQGAPWHISAAAWWRQGRRHAAAAATPETRRQLGPRRGRASCPLPP